MNRILAALVGALVLGLLLGRQPATAAPEKPPLVAAADLGAKIDDVSIEAYGVTNARVAMRYLALHKGDIVTQAAVLRDYTNLAMLAGLRTRLEIQHNGESGVGVLHWIVLGPVFKPTDHPFYGEMASRKPDA